MESKRNAARQKHGNSMQWTTFEDNDENCHPNLFAHQDHSFQVMKQKYTSWNNDHNTNDLEKNPFFQDCNEKNVHNLRSESAFSEGHNPFWTPNHDSSLLKQLKSRQCNYAHIKAFASLICKNTDLQYRGGFTCKRNLQYMLF